MVATCTNKHDFRQLLVNSPGSPYSLHSVTSFHQDLFAGKGQLFCKKAIPIHFSSEIPSFPGFSSTLKGIFSNECQRPETAVLSLGPCHVAFKCFHGVPWRAHTGSGHLLRSRSLEAHTPFCARTETEIVSGQPRFTFVLFFYIFGQVFLFSIKILQNQNPLKTYLLWKISRVLFKE